MSSTLIIILTTITISNIEVYVLMISKCDTFSCLSCFKGSSLAEPQLCTSSDQQRNVLPLYFEVQQIILCCRYWGEWSSIICSPLGFPFALRILLKLTGNWNPNCTVFSQAASGWTSPMASVQHNVFKQATSNAHYNYLVVIHLWIANSGR